MLCRNIGQSMFAIVCEDCNVVIKYNNCSECNAGYHRPTMDRHNNVIKGNLPLAIKGSDKFGCQECVK